MIIDTGNTKAFAPLAPGMHDARIVSIVFVGTFPNRFDGAPTKTIKVGYEVNSPGRKRVQYEDYNASLTPNAKFRKVIEAVLCRALSKDESFRFEYGNLIGKFCKLVVVNNPSKKDPTKVYANIQAVYPSTDEFESDRQLLIWDVRKDDLSALPEFVQRQVMQSEEWVAKHGQTVGTQYAFGQQVPGTTAQWTPAPVQPKQSAPPKPVMATASFDFE